MGERKKARRHFFCQKNGEGRRPSTPLRATPRQARLHFTVPSGTTSLKKQSFFFTSSQNSRSLACEDAPFHSACEEVSLRCPWSFLAARVRIVLPFTALRLHGGKPPWFFLLRWYVTLQRENFLWLKADCVHFPLTLPCRYSIWWNSWKVSTKRSFPIKSAEPEPVSEQTSTKRNTPTASLTLSPNCKSPSKIINSYRGNGGRK